MNSPPSNQRTVFVAHVNGRKDLSAAEQYGSLRDVFDTVSHNYITPAMIDHARRVLANWEPGDSLLMIGDPALCAVCMTVATEFTDHITTLSWDRVTFSYVPRHWDFGYNA